MQVLQAFPGVVNPTASSIIEMCRALYSSNEDMLLAIQSAVDMTVKPLSVSVATQRSAEIPAQTLAQPSLLQENLLSGTSSTCGTLTYADVVAQPASPCVRMYCFLPSSITQFSRTPPCKGTQKAAKTPKTPSTPTLAGISESTRMLIAKSKVCNHILALLTFPGRNYQTVILKYLLY